MVDNNKNDGHKLSDGVGGFGYGGSSGSGGFQHRFGSGMSPKIMLVQSEDLSTSATAEAQNEEARKALSLDRIKSLYGHVDESDFPLPRAWSSQDKCTSLGLTQNNLRVHYKGMPTRWS